MTRVNTLTEIWNTYNNNIINEGAKDRPIEGGIKKMGTKPGPGAVNANDDKAKTIQHSKSPGTTEPEYEIEGLKHPIDPKNAKNGDELYNSANFSSEKYTKKDKKIEKKVKESINNYMKSTFDKLFENVMGEEMHSGDNETQELDALGIDTEVEETDGGDVTVTLDREMAEKLCDILKAACGHDDDDDAEVEDYEEMEEDEDESEEEDELEEAIDAEDLGHSLVNAKETGLTSTGNNKVGSVKPKGGKASDSTKKYVEAEPKALGDKKAHLQGKNNKVGSLKVGDIVG